MEIQRKLIELLICTFSILVSIVQACRDQFPDLPLRGAARATCAGPVIGEDHFWSPSPPLSFLICPPSLMRWSSETPQTSINTRYPFKKKKKKRSNCLPGHQGSRLHRLLSAGSSCRRSAVDPRTKYRYYTRE